MKNFIAKMGAVLLASAAALTFTACKEEGDESASKKSSESILKDSRDGKTYKTVKIGDKVWMAENLNFDYNHGTAKSVCYENKPENCDKYGRLYTWAAAMDSAAIFSKDGARCGYGRECDAIGTARGVCPEGWHLPCMEFEELARAAGGKQDEMDSLKWNNVGRFLKSKTGWAEKDGESGNGTDDLGFGALPSGVYGSDLDAFRYEGVITIFWTSCGRDEFKAFNLILGSSLEHALIDVGPKSVGLSVRCVKNP